MLTLQSFVQKKMTKFRESLSESEITFFFHSNDAMWTSGLFFSQNTFPFTRDLIQLAPINFDKKRWTGDVYQLDTYLERQEFEP